MRSTFSAVAMAFAFFFISAEAPLLSTLHVSAVLLHVERDLHCSTGAAVHSCRCYFNCIITHADESESGKAHANCAGNEEN